MESIAREFYKEFETERVACVKNADRKNVARIAVAAIIVLLLLSLAASFLSVICECKGLELLSAASMAAMVLIAILAIRGKNQEEYEYFEDTLKLKTIEILRKHSLYFQPAVEYLLSNADGNKDHGFSSIFPKGGYWFLGIILPILIPSLLEHLQENYLLALLLLVILYFIIIATANICFYVYNRLAKGALDSPELIAKRMLNYAKFVIETEALSTKS